MSVPITRSRGDQPAGQHSPISPGRSAQPTAGHSSDAYSISSPGCYVSGIARHGNANPAQPSRCIPPDDHRNERTDTPLKGMKNQDRQNLQNVAPRARS
jgi:hypothetical protein